MKKQNALFTSLLLALSIIWPNIGTTHSAPPRVAVSITPFYALVAALMQGAGSPELLVAPGASPHQYVLTPKNTKLLNQADIIIWGGPELETFLVKSLDNIKAEPSNSIQIIQLDTTKGLLLLPSRQSPEWDPHEHEHHHSDLDHADHHHSHTIDMHFWLNTHNAISIANRIADRLSKFDPKNTKLYLENLHKLSIRLKSLDAKIKQQLAPLKSVPFIVFHDAYQYFEKQYGLNGAGSITLHPEVPPSAKRLHTIREIIIQKQAKCIFTEPQFQPKLVQSISEDLPIKIGELDPIGNQTENNADGYFILLENLADSMYQCLK